MKGERIEGVILRNHCELCVESTNRYQVDSLTSDGPCHLPMDTKESKKHTKKHKGERKEIGDLKGLQTSKRETTWSSP